MKKLFYLFLLICFLLIGIKIGEPTKDTASNQLQNEIEEFEDNLADPNNEYQYDTKKKISPNVTNSLAKTGEDVIGGIFKFTFGILESLLN